MTNRKGISTFIATLLLILLAVAGGVVIYAYTMGYLGGLGGTPQTGAMSLDSYTCTDGAAAPGPGDVLTMHVRNMGKSSLIFSAIYVDGTVKTASMTASATITEGGVGAWTLTDTTSGTFTAGRSYQIKVVCTDNTQLSFTVTAK